MVKMANLMQEGIARRETLKSKVKSGGLAVLSKIGQYRFMRRILRALPALPPPLALYQIQTLEVVYYYTQDPEERDRLIKRLGFLRSRNGFNPTPEAMIFSSDPKKVRLKIERAAENVRSIAENTHLTPKQRQGKYRAMPKETVILLADAVQRSLSEIFRFPEFLFDFFLANLEPGSDVSLTLAALEMAADWNDAALALHRSGTVWSLKAGGAPTNAELGDPPVAIFVDNNIDLQLAETLVRRHLPKTVVRFSNRARVSKRFSEMQSRLETQWEPIIEGSIAYYTSAEEKLDKAFMTQWRKMRDSLERLFPETPDQAGPLRSFGHAGFDLLSFLLEDRLYLLLRERQAWRNCLAKFNGKTTLVLSNRVDFIKELNGGSKGKKIENSIVVSFLPAEDLPVSLDMHPVPQCASSGKTIHRSRKELARHYEINIAKRPPLRPHVIMMTSAFPSYLEYAMALAQQLGPANCLIIDQNPAGVRIGAHARASAISVEYRIMTYMFDRNAVSNWEGELVDELHQTLAEHLTSESDNELTRLALGELDSQLVHFLRAFEEYLFLKDYLARAGKEIEFHDGNLMQPTLYLMPGRVPVSHCLAKHADDVFSVDIQFFWNSDSFRYKTPRSSLITTVDQDDSKKFKRRFELDDERVQCLGSPGIDAFLKNDIGVNMTLNKCKRHSMMRRHVLMVGQPKSFELWYPVLDAIRALVTLDPRFLVTIKLHPQNSNGTAKVFQSYLHDIPADCIRIMNGGNIYDEIKVTDVVLGWSSNSLVEAASLRKPVYVVRTDFVAKFMSQKNFGIMVDATEIASSILRYFDSDDERAKMLAIQRQYFSENPGMDALNEDYSFTDNLVAAIQSKRQPDCTMRDN